MTDAQLPSEGLLDTSVFIAAESGRGIDRSRLPEHAYVSVITLAELELGTLAADDPGERSVRMRTWARVSELETLDVDLGA
jgi:predicted nucleic acid-binding protein